jgi:hypothetical protein
VRRRVDLVAARRPDRLLPRPPAAQ